MSLKNNLAIMRPGQWVKNLVLFAGIIFSENLQDTSMLLQVLVGFALFCLLSSAGYVINDILDKREDSQHPHKADRPIASGRLKAFSAVFLALFLIIISLLGSYVLNVNFFIVALIYLLLSNYLELVWVK